MHTRALLRFALPALLLVLGSGRPSSAQSTGDAISARLKGQPLYLRSGWGEDKLKFDADGQPQKQYKEVTFTEAGIDVRSVKVSGDRLLIRGQRMGVVFPKGTPTRVPMTGRGYTGSISIEVQGVPGGDFGKALDVIFAPDLVSLVPSMPIYWQDYARKNLPSPTAASGVIKVAPGSQPTAVSSETITHVGGPVQKPSVISSVQPTFSDAARAMQISGSVGIYLWVMEDGSPAHMRIVKPAGLGMDEQALLALSKYKFKPAMQDGKPVRVDLYIDVNFQIF